MEKPWILNRVLKEMTDGFYVYYNDTILSHYEHTKHYWRKQIVTLEIFSNTSLSTNLIDKLRECFNLELIYTDNDQFRFVNSIYKILVHT